MHNDKLNDVNAFFSRVLKTPMSLSDAGVVLEIQRMVDLGVWATAIGVSALENLRDRNTTAGGNTDSEDARIAIEALAAVPEKR